MYLSHFLCKLRKIFHCSKFSQTYTAQGAPIDLSNLDVPTTNGLIHVLNAVMSPPSQTIYELVSSDPNFSTLLLAIDTAGIADIINSKC